MEVRFQFAGRYKKDVSLDNLRAKVARRNSIAQKENRHKAFRKSRGLSLADVNVFPIKEHRLTALEEVDEVGHGPGQENKPANRGKTKVQIARDERMAMLQRYKEEKQLRKMKEQREQAKKVNFKCGIYRPEKSLIPVLVTQTGAKIKPKEKPPVPNVTRVTRSTAKAEPPAIKTRTQADPVNVATSKVSERAIPKRREQTLVVKKNEAENKASAPSIRTTRSTVNVTPKITTAGKAPLKTAAATKPQKKPTRETSPEMVIVESEPPVVNPAIEKAQELEPIREDSDAERQQVMSFAPEDFVFQLLVELSAFTFQPMTPNRANAFLTPTFTSTPRPDTRNVVTREPNTKETDPMFPSEASLMTMEVKQDQNSNASSPAKSPIRKALFGMPEEESLQNQEPDPIVQNPEHAAADSVPALVDMAKDLVHTHAGSSAAVESPGLLQCLGLEASETTQDGCAPETEIETNLTTDVSMCSPEKDVYSQAAASLPEASEPGPDDDVKTTNDPVGLIGSFPPIMVHHSPMTVDFAALTDLITFSPIEK